MLLLFNFKTLFAHDFCVIGARKLARAGTQRNFPQAKLDSEINGATPKSRNRNPESGIGNPNSESRIRNPQIKENKFFKFAKIILHNFCL